MKQVLFVLAVMLMLVAMLAGPAGALKHPYSFQSPGGGDDQPWGGEQDNDDWYPQSGQTSSFDIPGSGIWLLDLIIDGVIRNWDSVTQSSIEPPNDNRGSSTDSETIEPEPPINDRVTVKGN